MRNVFLIHQDKIQHYRVSIYNYLSKYLSDNGYQLDVISNSIEGGSPYRINFRFKKIKLNTLNIINVNKKINPEAIIFFVNLKNLYLFPILLWCKRNKIKTIYWGHAIDLGNKQAVFKNFCYNLEHRLVDALLLYAPHLLQYVKPKWHSKCFIANNTLDLSDRHMPDVDPQEVKKKYKIITKKNIIYVGRIQKRKGLDLLLNALTLIDDGSVGLVLVGPNHDCDIDFSGYGNVYLLGPLFKRDLAEIMLSMDVSCIPKWVGLSIVDAFYFGLPLVTTDVDHPPEISYFKNGINGFMVPDGDVNAMADRLRVLLYDDDLRESMGKAARREILEKASINQMCEGFRKAIDYCLNQK